MSHKDTLLELSPGVNVIAGDSDGGKSSFVHGIELATLNRIMGKSPKWEVYKSWFPRTKETLVVEEFDDCTVSRRRANGVNAYKIDDQQDLDPVGTDQPIQVLEATRMGKINIQNQHEKYFLLQDTPGTVSSYLNELVGLEIIDQLTDGVASVARKTKTDLEASKELEARLTSDLQKYEVLDQLEPLLNEASALEQSLEQDEQLFERLSRLDVSFTKSEEELNTVLDWLEVKDSYTELQALNSELNRLTTQHARLEVLARNFDRQSTSLDDLNSFLGVRARVNPLNALVTSLDALNTEGLKLARLVTSYDNTSNRLQAVVNRLDQKRAEYEVVLRRAGVCPTCGSEITEDICARIWE